MPKYCNQCGAALADGARFCSECGTKVPTETPPKRFCPSCGKKLPGESAFCPACGTRIAAPSAPKEQAPAARPSIPSVPAAVQPRRTMPPAGTTRTNPASAAPPRTDRPQTAPAQKNRKGLCVFLSLVMVAEFCVAAFKYPGFLRKDGGGSGLISGGGHVSKEVDAYAAEILGSIGVTQDQLNALLSEPIEATPENSPGNPKFIKTAYTAEDYANAKTLTAEVSRENPTADFPEFGIHVDLKPWNLDNETDTLIVKKLPAKTDAATDCDLYTYDYSLASGQHEFYTDVEITAPLQGTPSAFDGVLHLNEETGVWEAVYCELSEDGLSYTAYLRHFSGATERTNRKLKDLTGQVEQGIEQFKLNGETIFRILPTEYRPKYQNSNTFLYQIGIRSGWKIEDFFSQQTKDSLRLYDNILHKTGGIPAEAGEAESWGTLIYKTDASSVGMTEIENNFSETEVWRKIKSIKGASAGWQSLGAVFSVVGLSSLFMRITDQFERGVNLDKIFSSNKWNFVSAAASAAGLFCAACKAIGVTAIAGVSLTSVATGAAVVGAAVFAYTTVDGWAEASATAKKPLGNPRTIEEAAYHYFLSTYATDPSEQTDEDYEISSARTFTRLMNENWTSFDSSHFQGVCTLDIRGNGWAKALSYLFEKYRDDPETLAKMIEKLHGGFIDQFWTKEVNSGVKYDCWQKAMQKLLDEDHEADYYGHYRVKEGDPSGFAVVLSDEDHAKALGITLDELERRRNIQTVLDEGRSMNDLFDGRLDREAYVRFNKLTQSEIDSYKACARGVLNRNLNPIVYAVYQSCQKAAFREIMDQYYDVVLPLLNTRITFYMKDKAITNGVMSQKTKYDHFGFVDFTEPLFEPSNREIGPHTTVYGMTLERRSDTPILLETLVYHYVRIGCPTRVNVRCTKDGMSTDGYANWEGVKITADVNSVWNGLEEDKWGSELEESRKVIKDMKVPIEYTGTYEEEKEEKPVYTVTPGYADLYFKDVESSETGSITISSDGTVTLNVPAHTTKYYTMGDDTPFYSIHSGFSVRGYTGKGNYEPEPGGSGWIYLTEAPDSVSIKYTSNGSSKTLTDIKVSDRDDWEKESMTIEEKANVRRIYFYVDYDSACNIEKVTLTLFGTQHYSSGADPNSGQWKYVLYAGTP